MLAVTKVGLMSEVQYRRIFLSLQSLIYPQTVPGCSVHNTLRSFDTDGGGAQSSLYCGLFTERQLGEDHAYPRGPILSKRPHVIVFIVNFPRFSALVFLERCKLYAKV